MLQSVSQVSIVLPTIHEVDLFRYTLFKNIKHTFKPHTSHSGNLHSDRKTSHQLPTLMFVFILVITGR